MKYKVIKNFNYNTNQYLKDDILDTEENLKSLVKRGLLVVIESDCNKKSEEVKQEESSHDTNCDKVKYSKDCKEFIWQEELDRKTEFSEIKEDIEKVSSNILDIETDISHISNGRAATARDVDEIAKDYKKPLKNLEEVNTKSIEELNKKIKPKKAKLDLKQSELVEESKKVKNKVIKKIKK